MKEIEIPFPHHHHRYQDKNECVFKENLTDRKTDDGQSIPYAALYIADATKHSKCNANNVAERLRKMSIRFSVVIHAYNVLSHSWD